MWESALLMLLVFSCWFLVFRASPDLARYANFSFHVSKRFGKFIKLFIVLFGNF